MLPAACVECEHYSNEPDPRGPDARFAVLTCAEPTVVRRGALDREVSDEDAPPPAWCPLRRQSRGGVEIS